jgi:O-antigen ligase
MQYGIYGATFLLIILRFKSVIRPAMRDPFIWALIAIIVTSFFWSDFPDVSRKYGFRTLYTTLLGLYLASRYSLQEQLRIVAWALGIGVVFSLLYTLAFPGSGIEQGFHAGAWRGPLVHKNPFARLMVVSALSLLLAALNTRRSRYFVWAVFSIAIALLVLSTSKTAIVIFVTLVILVPLYKALSWSDSLVIPFSITVILVGGSAATWLIGNWDPLLVQLGKDSTLSGRTDIWDGVIEKIWERPWLGYGYQAFWQEGGEADLVWRSIRYKVFQAHNGFLDIGIQIGLLGLLFFVLSVIFAYIRAIKWARLGKTSADLWPIIYITFLPMYNYTESTIVEANSLYWVLFVAITLTLRLIPVVTPTEESESLRRERLVGQI